jgi:predicted nucleic acid-binding protein
MTVVVADTSPLNYLVLIEASDILQSLYGRIVVPETVLAELRHTGAPAPVRQWALDLPEWIDVRPSPPDDPALSHLDPGERSAILIALGEQEVLLLIDEAAGRQAASRRGIPVTGTVGVLRAASIAGLIDLQFALTRLAATNFRISSRLVDELIAEDERRRSASWVKRSDCAGQPILAAVTCQVTSQPPLRRPQSGLVAPQNLASSSRHLHDCGHFGRAFRLEGRHCPFEHL